MVLAAAGTTWWIDTALAHRVSDGSDHAVRLAAVLIYVGINDAYTLARALGITAMIFAYLTLLLGLTIPKGHARIRGAMASLHRQVGTTTVALVAAHAAVPFSSVLPPYGGWRTNFLPWAQPVSWGIRAASWESLGILAFYLLVLAGPTYYLVQRRRRAWKVAHWITVLAYGLAVGHVLLLGTDFLVAGAARVALLAAQVPLLALLCRRLVPRSPEPVADTAPDMRRRSAPIEPVRWAAVVITAAAAAGFGALTVLSATGEYAQGMRL